MASEIKPARVQKQRSQSVPLLHSGDRLTQPEFHRRYAQYPDDTRFELIAGIVYMASPLGLPHGSYDLDIAGLLFFYIAATPGVHGAQNVTVVLGYQSEPQPDAILRILPEYGGRTQTTRDKYLNGGPELIIEIAHSSVAIDLHAKREVYRLAGVHEYIVVCVDESEVRWFDLASDRELTLDTTGILRSREFPGFWLDTIALFDLSKPRLIATLQEGLASSEHAAYVKWLEEQIAKPMPSAKSEAKPRRKKK